MSERLTDIVKSVSKHPLTEKLKVEVKEPKFNYLDINDKELSLSFLDTAREKQIVAPSTPFTTALRQEGKIGRILKKIVPAASDDEIRTFVEAVQGFLATDYKYLLVPGTEIRKVYQWPLHWCDETSSSYSFRSSCYQGQATDENFELFSLNPERIRAAVVIKNRKLCGRSLVVINEEGTEYHQCEQRLGHTKLSAPLNKFVELELKGMNRYTCNYSKPFKSIHLNSGVPLDHWAMHYVEGHKEYGNFLYYGNVGGLQNCKFRRPASNSYYNKKVTEHLNGIKDVPSDEELEKLNLKFW